MPDTASVMPSRSGHLLRYTAETMPMAMPKITKSDAVTSISPSDTVTYTITVTNPGPSPATNVVISDTLPAGFAYASAFERDEAIRVIGVVRVLPRGRAYDR